VVAQIYGIGLIASRLTGVQFEIGILLGLGGVLLCSFLGGMRAITWTQVAQYIVLLLAFLIPVSWLAYQQLGTPLAPLAYGKQLAKIEALENMLIDDPAELEVRQEFAAGHACMRSVCKMSSVRWTNCGPIWRKRFACSKRKGLILRRWRRPGVNCWRCPVTLCKRMSNGPVPCVRTRSAHVLWGDASPCTGISGRSRRRCTGCAHLRCFSHQLPGIGLVPDVGDGGSATPAHALLHLA